MDQLFLIAYAIGVGAISGVLGGLLGIGGGVVIVPALILFLDSQPQFDPQLVTLVAVATSLSCVLGTSLSAARAQLRAGKVQWPVVRRWGLPLTAGAVLAGQIAQRLPLVSLRLLIGGFLICVAVVMASNWRPAPHRPAPGFAVTGVTGFFGGIISGIAGIGGGNVIVPTLVYFNTPVHNATANSSTLGVPIALSGTVGYLWAAAQAGPLLRDAVPWLFGYIYLPASVVIVTMAMLCAPLGVALAHRLDPLPLRRLFALLLVLVSTRMVYTALVS